MSRSLICLTLFCVAFQQPTAAGATPESLNAQGLCDQGHYLEAIELFDRILEGPIEKDAGAEVDAALDRCMLLVERADDSEALLATIKSREGKPSGLKALSTLARHEFVWQEACEKVGPLYRELVGLHGATREAARMMITRAIRCHDVPGHEAEALRDLETVASLQTGQPEGAMALYELGHHYRNREERDRAAVYYQKLVDFYPESLEYPHTPGLRIVRWARSDLVFLHLYFFSPRLDRVKAWLDREVLRGVLHLDVSVASALSIGLVPRLVALGALGLALLLASVLRRLIPQSPESGESLFVRKWTVWHAFLLLTGCWTLFLLLQLVSELSGFHERLGSVWRFLDFNGGIDFILAVTVFVAVLRKEPLGRIFAIDRRRLVRLGLWTAGAIVGTAVIPGLLLRALRGAGIVDSGSGLDRYLSTESTWPSEWWSFGLLVVVLSVVREEVVYRGVLHDALRRVVPRPAAAVLGSFVFAMAHTRPVQYTVGVFVMGIVLVFVRERFRSLAPGAIVHSLWNLVAFSLK